MIAEWMLYCSLCALGLALAAALAERALLAGRGPVRLVWIGAVALSLLIPMVAYRFAPRPAADDTASVSDEATRALPLDTRSAGAPAVEAPPRAVVEGRELRARLASFNEPLAVLWVTLSLALAINFFGGIVTLAWMRRSWQRRTVHGISVFVSERAGPAVVGVLSPSIVVPEWVLALEQEQLSLLLRHEQEHQRAGDGRLLTLAQLALIAMPWNIALWWQLVRLRMAVELDCDVRVLRHGNARSYGDLLLEVARPRRGPSLMGATAFAERAAQLERRIEVLARHRVRTPRAARAIATCTGLVVVAVAWVAPRPPAPARQPVSVSAPGPAGAPAEGMAITPLTPNSDNTDRGNARSSVTETGAPERTARGESSAANGAASDRDGARSAMAPPAANTTQPAGGRVDGQDVRLADVAFRRLFDGITLTPEAEARARAILAELEQQQIAQDMAAAATALSNRALQARRDTALRALLTNEADRAEFDARVAQGSPGSRGRSGGAGNNWTSPRRGGAGDTIAWRPSGRRGREGGAGARGAAPELTEAFTATMVDLAFHRLFDGIELTAEQESSARALIQSTQLEIMARALRIPVLRLDRVTGLVSVRPPSDSALIALVSNEADRATVRSRIMTPPR